MRGAGDDEGSPEQRTGTKRRVVPKAARIDGQPGSVGPTEREAQRAGQDGLAGMMATSQVARALETDETRGLMKVIVDADSDQILGAAILGVEGCEVMSAIQVAMMGDVPRGILLDRIRPPALTESLNNLFASLES